MACLLNPQPAADSRSAAPAEPSGSSATPAEKSPVAEGAAKQRHVYTLAIQYQAPGAQASTEVPTEVVPTVVAPVNNLVPAAGTTPSGLSDKIHAKQVTSLLVSEESVRALVAAKGLVLHATLSRRLYDEATSAEVGESSVLGIAHLPCDMGALLVGDTHALYTWPNAEQPLPDCFQGHCTQVSIDVSSWSRAALEPPVAPAAASKQSVPTTQEPPAAPAPRQPVKLLPPGLEQRLNPIVISLASAHLLPDLPASQTLLDERCYKCQCRCAAILLHAVLGSLERRYLLLHPHMRMQLDMYVCM